MRRTIVRSLGALLVATGTLVVGVIPPTSAATCQSWGTQPPSPGTNNNDLLAVTVLSACNVWAVGTRSDTPLATRTLIEHWNGTAWTVAPSPSPSDVSNELAGVGASSPKDMWAVGYSSNGTSFRPLIEHYNGLGWRAVRAPHTGTGGGLVGVVAFGKKDAWAVGSTTLASGGTRELIEHWNGHAWKIQASPNVGTQNGFVGGIDGSSPKGHLGRRVSGPVRGERVDDADRALERHRVEGRQGAERERLREPAVRGLGGLPIRRVGGRLLRCLRQAVAYVA